MKKTLEVLNNCLVSRTYLVGERITLADIIVGMSLLNLYKYVLEPSVRKPYQNLNRWFQTVINQPQVIAVLGAFKFADKAIEYDPKKASENQAKVRFQLRTKSNNLISLQVHIYLFDFFTACQKREEGKRTQEREGRRYGCR